jgi:hypothetical protein
MSGELSNDVEHPVFKVGNYLVAGSSKARLELMQKVSQEVKAPEDIQSVLVLARHVTDQIEMALVKALTLRRQAETELAIARAETEEAEIAAASAIRKDAGLYATAKEKTVEFSRRTLTERRAERIAKETYDQACHVVEVLRLLHKGVDQTRQDVATQLRAITLTTSLERG